MSKTKPQTRKIAVTDLLEIYDRAVTADMALQAWYPQLECVLSEPVLAQLNLALAQLNHIEQVAEKGMGGVEARVRLKNP